MDTPAKGPRRWRWQWRVLGVVVVVGVCGVVSQRDRLAERLIEHYASAATGKVVDAQGVRVGRRVEIDTLTITDAQAPGVPLGKIEGLSIAPWMGGGYALSIDELAARRVEVTWKSVPGATGDVAVQGPGLLDVLQSQLEAAGAYLPYSIQIDALYIDAEMPGNAVQLGPVSVKGRLRPLTHVSLEVAGRPEIRATRADIDAPITASGEVKIDVLREAGVLRSTVAMALPGVASVDAKVTAARAADGLAFGAEVAQGTLEGPLWPLLLGRIAGVPISFEKLEVAAGAKVSGTAGAAGYVFKVSNAVLSVPRLQAGPAEAPWFDAPLALTVAEAAEGKGVATLGVAVGKEWSASATLTALAPLTLEVTLPAARVAALVKSAPVLASVTKALPGLKELSGTAVLSPGAEAGAALAKLELTGALEGMDDPLRLTGAFAAGTPAQVSGTLRVGEETRLEVPAFALAGADARAAFRGVIDLSAAGPLVGLEGAGGTVEFSGDVTPLAAVVAGKVEATCLNVVSDYFRLPYEVPMTVSLKYAVEKAGPVLSDVVAAVGDQFSAKVGKVRMGNAVSAEAVSLTAALPFLATQGYLESGEGALTYAADSVSYAAGTVRVAGKFTVDAKQLVLPDKLGAAVGLTGGGELGWEEHLVVSGELKAEQILCAGAVLEGASARLKGEGPALLIEDLKGRLFGGAAVGTARVEPFAEGMPMKLDARVEGADLAMFTAQVQPPSVNLTGMVSGDVLVGLRGEDFTELNIDLNASSGITVNRTLVQELLLSQQMSGMTGSKMVGKVLKKIVGGEEQRPFDSAALKLGLGEGRIVGVASMKSKALNLDVDIKADPGAVWEAVQSRGEIHFGDFSTQ
jgi:hypothetical protein